MARRTQKDGQRKTILVAARHDECHFAAAVRDRSDEIRAGRSGKSYLTAIEHDIRLCTQRVSDSIDGSPDYSA